MNRREFVKIGGSVLAATTVQAGAMPASADALSSGQPDGRIMQPLNRGWRFYPGKHSGAQRMDFDDSDFAQVVVPHTNIELPWHSFDDREYEFISTYRRKFRLPSDVRNKRVFVDFEGVMTASKVWLNGICLGEYKGGYTPFSFELTPHLHFASDNLLTVEVDSTERADIPPFGNRLDYMTFGGIYREVALRIVPRTFIENVFARTMRVLGAPAVAVDCFVQCDETGGEPWNVEAIVLDGNREIGHGMATLARPESDGLSRYTVMVEKLDDVKLWDVDAPVLYTVLVRLLKNDRAADEKTCRVGIREARFTDHGFELNGKILKLRGLNRHQTFPFVGSAMPARVQRRDAAILKHLHCNIVRTSHYPQSRHFLDACDELGLLVLEEIPGWQHIGDSKWQDLSVDNVRRMITRDWNHPSIVLWGARINESPDDHDFYSRTNAMARALDPTRQTCGIRAIQESEFLEDVFTMNDFGWPLKAPNHPRYLNTEFVGHTYPVRHYDDDERQREHVIHHARVHDQLASNPQYSGGIGWCAFDYNTHRESSSGDRMCYHGVFDIFREPKLAAGFYKSQCEPAQEAVLEPAFYWAKGDEASGFHTAMICTNCEAVKVSMGNNGSWTYIRDAAPDRATFPHLKFPPHVVEIHPGHEQVPWGDLRLDGYVGGKLVITKMLSGRGIDQKFELLADDEELVADGADATRIVMRVTDEYGAPRPFANDPIRLLLEGPADLVGDNPFALVGGRGAVWVRARQQPGLVEVAAIHPRLGTRRLQLKLQHSPAELV